MASAPEKLADSGTSNSSVVASSDDASSSNNINYDGPDTCQKTGTKTPNISTEFVNQDEVDDACLVPIQSTVCRSSPEKNIPLISAEESNDASEVQTACKEVSCINDVSVDGIEKSDAMGRNDSSKVEEQEMGITLTDLPTEVFLQICSYLSPRFLMQTCRLVCKRLYGILSDDFIWRSRIYKRWSQVYPPVPAEQECVDWKAACMNLEEQQERWSNMQSAMKCLSWRDVHFAPIDAIMLISRGTLCVSGSRDRSMAVWNVATRDPKPIVHIDAHQGWIWDLAPKSDSSFYSCSWDNTAKLWSLEEGRLTCVDTFKSKFPLLSVVCSPNLVALGSQDKRVLLYDPRCSATPTHTYTAHRQAVLRLALLTENADDSCIVSISEDRTLAVWDLRACKLLKENVKVPSSESAAIPMCMSLTNDMLYIGDTRGQLHLVDPRRESATSFQVLASYDAGHRDQSKITAVRHGLGCVITGSSDGTVRVSTPTHHPEFITSFSTAGRQVACMDFQHGTLAVGCTDCAVELWVPDNDDIVV